MKKQAARKTRFRGAIAKIQTSCLDEGLTIEVEDLPEDSVPYLPTMTLRTPSGEIISITTWLAEVEGAIRGWIMRGRELAKQQGGKS